ncbi:HNH endonuclease [Agrobacterium tumefaciens]|nr:HNH endonuclease [Agrobacterium tumefaciens]
MMPYVVNVADIEQALSSLGGEAKASDIQNTVLRIFCDGIIPTQYYNERSFRMTIQRIIENYCPQAQGFKRERYDEKFLRIRRGVYRLNTNQLENVLGDEILRPDRFYEGSITKISVNSFERSSKARSECIKHHGYSCKVCSMDFASQYGDIGIGYIHVHHLIPLSSISKGYEVNPITDLVPVCPNCHAMLHAGATSLSDLKERMRIALLSRKTNKKY